MREDRTFEKVVRGAIALVIVLIGIGWATREDPGEKPYLLIAGCGFIYNYRVADVFYGFTAYVNKPVSSGSIIVAEFEDPAGGPPLRVEKRVNARTNRYGLRSPSVQGVEAGRPYRVGISLYDHTGKELIWATERQYSAMLGDQVVPDEPLTIGPGYHRNPAASGDEGSQEAG